MNERIVYCHIVEVDFMSDRVTYAELRDFDWSARIVLASDKISGLKQPLVILKLFLDKGDGELEEKEIELSKQELNSLLTSLKQARQKIKENFQA